MELWTVHTLNRVYDIVFTTTLARSINSCISIYISPTLFSIYVFTWDVYASSFKFSWITCTIVKKNTSSDNSWTFFHITIWLDQIWILSALIDDNSLKYFSRHINSYYIEWRADLTETCLLHVGLRFYILISLFTYKVWVKLPSIFHSLIFLLSGD